MLTRRGAAREKLRDFAQAAKSRFDARDESGETHRVRGSKETARTAAKKLVRGAKYVAPHPLEGLKGKTVVQKVHTVAKRSAKYAAVGAVAVAALPATAGVATLAGLGGLTVAAVGARRKLRDRRLGVNQPSRVPNPLAADPPDGATTGESKEVDPDPTPRTESNTGPKPRYTAHWEGEGADRKLVPDEVMPPERTVDVPGPSGSTRSGPDDESQPSGGRRVDSGAPTVW